MSTRHSAISYPPGPPPAPVIGSLLPFRRDPLSFLLETARSYGDITHFKLGKYSIYLVNHPDYIRQVLVTDVDKFEKSMPYKRLLSRFLGNGLLISDGEFWRRQRRLVGPAFHVKRIESYAQVMVDYTQDMLAGWQAGQTRDLAEDMMRLTLFIVAKTLFDADVAQEARGIGDALEVLLYAVIERSQVLIELPQWMPTPLRLRENAALRILDAVTMRIIEDRRRSGQDTGDLLSMLLLAQDEEGGGMTDTQVRDEALTLFLAGHETTANALTWTWYLLSQHPEIEARLHHELDTVLQGRPPALDDLKNLPCTEMVIKEAMRLYPPAWGFGRQTLEPVMVGAYTIPPVRGVMIIPYVTHRDPRFFPQPERFDPERFSAENEPHIPKMAYIPFGGGQRICIGSSFAMMEARLILSSVAQRYRPVLAPGHVVEPEPLVTLRPRHGMRMLLQERQPQAGINSREAGSPVQDSG